MTDTNQLPPLPEPEGVIVVGTQALRGFTADQMRAYALQSRAQLVQGETVSDAEIVAALEAAGVKFQRFMGGISGTQDCWSTAGSQDVRKLLAGVRAILALRPAAQEVTPKPARQCNECSITHDIGACEQPAPQQATPEQAATCPDCEASGYLDPGVPDSPDGPGRPAVVCGSCNGTGWRNGAHWSDQQATPEPVGEPFGQVTVKQIDLPNHAPIYTFYPWPQIPYLDNVQECHTVYTRPAHAAQAVPMTDEQIRKLFSEKHWHELGEYPFTWGAAQVIIRAAEAHHGITAQAKEVQS